MQKYTSAAVLSVDKGEGGNSHGTTLPIYLISIGVFGLICILITAYVVYLRYPKQSKPVIGSKCDVLFSSILPWRRSVKYSRFLLKTEYEFGHLNSISKLIIIMFFCCLINYLLRNSVCKTRTIQFWPFIKCLELTDFCLMAFGYCVTSWTISEGWPVKE